MRRCIVNDAGQVVYYLHPDDSTLKADGSAAVLDGTDGQVMVEIPEHYRYHYDDGETQEWRLSTMPLPGYIKIEKQYFGAYKAALNRSTNKLSSVVNLTTTYRGGGNQSAWDAEARTMLGKPVTAISRTNFRTYAANRGAGWCQWHYDAWMTMFWLFLVEYATRNCQTTVNTARDRLGNKQGGLGNGVSTVSSADWNTYNGYYPLIPCGTSNSLGNSTGEVSYSIPSFPGATGAVKVNSYRGIENPFGDIWEWMDGCNIYHQTAAEGGRSLLYRIAETKRFSDLINLHNTLLTNRLARAEGYVKAIVGGRDGVLMSAVNGAGSTTYWSDYNYLNVTSNAGLKAPIVGGYAYYDAYAGVGCVRSNSAASVTAASFGSRLVYRTK
jgi:hypothetical protein